MKKLFVAYSIALQLKDKGFDEHCLRLYVNEKTYKTRIATYDYINNTLLLKFKDDKYCAAPLYQQVVDWFREKHKLHIKITRDGGHWIFTAHDIKNEDKESSETHPIYLVSNSIDYIIAFNEAIDQALKLI